MYAGVPRALPGSVSELPLADDGISSRSPESVPGRARPVGLASPQSTTRVSPCLPTMIFAGLMSRWSTPREWAYSMALQTSMNRRSSLRSSRSREVAAAAGRWKCVDRFLEAVAADEPHGVIRAAVAVSAQSVDRDDTGVLEAAGDLGLDEEAVSAGGVVGAVVEDLLEGDLAVELGVEGNEDRAQAASGVRPEDAEPLSVGGGRADGIGAGAVGVIVVVGRAQRRADVPEGRLDVRAAGRARAFASRASDGQDGKALTGVAAECLDMQAGDGLDGGAARGIEVAEVDKVVGQGSALVASPGGEGREQRPLVDQSVLQGQQTEEKVAIGIDGGH